MLQTRNRLKRVPTLSHGAIWTCLVTSIILLGTLSTPSTAATTISSPIRGVPALTIKATPLVHVATRVRPHHAVAVVAELADFTSNPTPSDGRIVTLIHQDFPARAWHDAEAVAWCESKFRADDIGFDSNGTHDRGLFQLNDGGTEQYLMAMIGQNPKNLNLAFNPVLNVRAAALLYSRDGWSQWSCESAI
jgi:hypothetical protein